jgi:hypothetical protein
MLEIHEQLHARSDGVSGVRGGGQNTGQNTVQAGSDAAPRRTTEN